VTATETSPSAVHLTAVPGALSEQWIDAQVRSWEMFRPRLWSMYLPKDPYHWETWPEFVARRDARVVRGVAAQRRLRLPWDDDAKFRLALLRGGVDVPPRAVAHAHFGPTAFLFARFCRSRSVPLVVSFYGADACSAQYTSGRWRARYRTLFRHIAGVLVEGPVLGARVAALGCPEERIHVVRLPTTIPDLHAPGGDGGDAFDVFLGGRFVAKKGFDVALRAFARAFPSSDERVVLVGDGPEDPHVRSLARSLGIADRVTFLGPLPPARFTEVMTSSRVAAFPSVTAPDGDSEGGAPVTLTMAQGLGVPVVVSDHADLPWAAAPGTPVVPAGDVDALAGALRDLVRGARCGASAVVDQASAARAFVVREHEPMALARRREAVYQAALSG
jgi:colanic acid/amylovoran biosynthesis glycosyltransferase